MFDLIVLSIYIDLLANVFVFQQSIAFNKFKFCTYCFLRFVGLRKWILSNYFFFRKSGGDASEREESNTEMEPEVPGLEISEEKNEEVPKKYILSFVATLFVSPKISFSALVSTGFL